MKKPVLDISDPELVNLLKRGAVGVLPTDTVYGLVCRAEDRQAVKRLYSLKSRSGKPGTVIASSTRQLIDLGIDKDSVKIAEKYWPAPVSVQIFHHLDYLSQSSGRQAFRIPDSPLLVDLMNKTGPLQTTSANMPGEPEAVNISEAINYFANKVDFYVDGGDLSKSLPSTVIGINGDKVEIYRQGAVTIDE